MIWSNLDMNQPKRPKRRAEAEESRNLVLLGVMLSEAQGKNEGKKVLAEFNEHIQSWYRRGQVWPFMLVAVGLGLFAGILAEMRRGFSAALHLVAAALGPVLV